MNFDGLNIETCRWLHPNWMIVCTKLILSMGNLFKFQLTCCQFIMLSVFFLSKRNLITIQSIWYIRRQQLSWNNSKYQIHTNRFLCYVHQYFSNGLVFGNFLILFENIGTSSHRAKIIFLTASYRVFYTARNNSNAVLMTLWYLRISTLFFWTCCFVMISDSFLSDIKFLNRKYLKMMNFQPTRFMWW